MTQYLSCRGVLELDFAITDLFWDTDVEGTAVDCVDADRETKRSARATTTPETTTTTDRVDEVLRRAGNVPLLPPRELDMWRVC